MGFANLERLAQGEDIEQPTEVKNGVESRSSRCSASFLLGRKFALTLPTIFVSSGDQIKLPPTNFGISVP